MAGSVAKTPAPVSPGVFRWIATLTPRERNTFTACVGGWALDAMNVQIYSFVIPALIATWGITRGQAGVLGTAALLVSAVGGWFAGWFADRFGRVLHPADRDPVVRRVHVPLRARAKLRAIVRGARCCWDSASAANGPRERCCWAK